MADGRPYARDHKRPTHFLHHHHHHHHHNLQLKFLSSSFFLFSQPFLLFPPFVFLNLPPSRWLFFLPSNLSLVSPVHPFPLPSLFPAFLPSQSPSSSLCSFSLVLVLVTSLLSSGLLFNLLLLVGRCLAAVRS